MGSAHPLVEVNVSFKFEGNPSISYIIELETDGPTRQSESSIAPPPHILWWGYNKALFTPPMLFFRLNDQQKGENQVWRISVK